MVASVRGTGNMWSGWVLVRFNSGLLVIFVWSVCDAGICVAVQCVAVLLSCCAVVLYGIVVLLSCGNLVLLFCCVVFRVRQ